QTRSRASWRRRATAASTSRGRAPRARSTASSSAARPRRLRRRRPTAWPSRPSARPPRTPASPTGRSTSTRAGPCAGARSRPSPATATPATAAPDAVPGLTAVAGSGRVDLSWANPTTAFDDVVVVGKTGSPPTDPADGTVLLRGTGTTASQTGLADGTLVYYAA